MPTKKATVGGAFVSKDVVNAGARFEHSTLVTTSPAKFLFFGRMNLPERFGGEEIDLPSSSK